MQSAAHGGTPESSRLAIAQLPATDVGIVGGGCAGLAAALAIVLASPGRRITVLDGRVPERDGRTWCFWDEGSNPVPRAVSASWNTWEIRTSNGASESVVTASDPEHPYRMMRAADYRLAMIERLETTGSVSVIQGVHVRSISATAAGGRADSSAGVLDASSMLDARGGSAGVGGVRRGRALLHQRFLGQWITSTRPVFDPGVVTLMDFTVAQTGSDVRFFYVLPISPTEALVESTVLTADSVEPIDFRSQIEAYLARRWALVPADYSIVGQEAGSIPMTDGRPRSGPVTAVGAQAGVTRPSTGYAFSRIHRHSAQIGRAVAEGAPLPVHRDGWRTRALDAIFLRFLRDQPQRAGAVFGIMFSRLPGPLTVRFLTERSTVIDELRLIAVLPKLTFLRAAFTTIVERIAGARQ